MVHARRAVVSDAAELVRLRQIMLAEMAGTEPSLGDWEESTADSLRTRLAEPDGTLAAFVIDQQPDNDPTPNQEDWPGTGTPDAADHLVQPSMRTGWLAACAVGLIEPRLGSPGNPGGEIGFILNVATDPAHRRRGYSRACMEALLSWYRERGIGTVDLQATDEGEPLYRSLGFVPAPHATMRLSVPTLAPQPR